MRVEEDYLKELLQSCNDRATIESSNTGLLIDHELTTVRVLVHYNYQEAEVPPKLPSFYFEVEPGFVFPPEVPFDGRSVHLEQLIKHHGPIRIATYWINMCK